MPETHYFRARIDSMVAGMDDTAVVAVEAGSKSRAVASACERKFDKDDYFKFAEDVWPEEALIGDENSLPSTGPVHYLGTAESLHGNGDVVMLSEMDGEKVTADDL